MIGRQEEGGGDNITDYKCSDTSEAQTLSKSSSKDFHCRLALPEINQRFLTRIKMNSEDCSLTENSSLHLERGQQSKSDLIFMYW